jgi:Response regulator containing a CheY-like receiver domain and a GGDEF domain
MSDSPPGVVLVADDLMFPSRIREGLRPMGGSLRVVGTEAALMAALAEAPADAVLVNLTARRYDPVSVIRALKSGEATRSVPVLAFAGHVEKEKHEAAREAGADMVAANSSVSMHLPTLLGRLLRGERTDSASDAGEGDA